MTIEYADGTIEQFLVPKDQGFVQEHLTYRAREGEHTGLNKWERHPVKTFNIYWVVA